MTRWTWVVVLSAVVGCQSDVEVVGRVMAGFLDEDVVAGAQVSLFDGDLNPLSTGTTDGSGNFRLTAPPQVALHLLVEGDGLVPAMFPGESGPVSFIIPDGQVFAVTEAAAAQQRTDFAGCPGADGTAGFLFGTAWVELTDPELLAESPPDPTAFVFVEETDGTGRRDACYLTDDGSAVADGSERTGDTGRFALFDLEGGPWVLSVARDATEGTAVSKSIVHVPEGGVLARLPAFTPFQ